MHRISLTALLTLFTVLPTACVQEKPTTPPANGSTPEKKTTAAKPPEKAATKEAAMVPAKPAGAAKFTSADKKLARMRWVTCGTCHGNKGKGDGLAGMALKPRPRDFTDPKFQAEKTDEHLFKVIKGGGAAVGLSVANDRESGPLGRRDLRLGRPRPQARRQEVEAAGRSGPAPGGGTLYSASPLGPTARGGPLLRPRLLLGVAAVLATTISAQRPTKPPGPASDRKAPERPTERETARCAAHAIQAWVQAFVRGKIDPKQAVFVSTTSKLRYLQLAFEQRALIPPRKRYKTTHFTLLQRMISRAELVPMREVAEALLAVSSAGYSRDLYSRRTIMVRDLGHFALTRTDDPTLWLHVLRVASGAAEMPRLASAVLFVGDAQDENADQTKELADTAQAMRRVAAIRLLGIKRNPVFMITLEKCLSDPDPRVRLAAAEAFGTLRELKMLYPLARRAAKEEHQMVVMALLSAVERTLKRFEKKVPVARGLSVMRMLVPVLGSPRLAQRHGASQTAATLPGPIGGPGADPSAARGPSGDRPAAQSRQQERLADPRQRNLQDPASRHRCDRAPGSRQVAGVLGGGKRPAAARRSLPARAPSSYGHGRHVLRDPCRRA